MKFDKEKVITVAAIAAGLGALLILQKLTTPKPRPRPAGGSHGGPLRHPHQHTAQSPQSQLFVNGVGESVRVPSELRRDATRSTSRGRAGINSTASRTRSHSQSNAAAAVRGAADRRSHRGSHPTSNIAALPPSLPQGPQRRAHTNACHDGGKSTSHGAVANIGNGETEATKQVPLTVQTLSDHYLKEGNLGPVRERLSSADPDAHREFPVSSSPPREPPPPQQRSPSNVATVGSKSIEGVDLVMHAAALHLPLPHAEAVNQAKDAARRTAVQPPHTARHKRLHNDKANAALKMDSATETDTTWFTEHRGTQTEQERTELLAGALTPAQKRSGTSPLHTARRGDYGLPVDAAGEDASELALSPINRQDPGEGLDSSSPTPLNKTSDAVAKEKRQRDADESISEEEDVTFIPLYLLLEAERQISAIVSSVYTTAPHNATSWMVLYCYLKELPKRALARLHERKRLAPLPSADVEPHCGKGAVVEGQRDLEAEVRRLLSFDASTEANDAFYYKWKGSKIVRRDGDYHEALARKLAEHKEKNLRRTTENAQRFAHLLVKDEDEDKNVTGAGKNPITALGCIGGTAEREDTWHEQSDADRVAVVVRRYAFVLRQGASTQTEDAATGSSAFVDVNANTAPRDNRDYNTPNSNTTHRAEKEGRLLMQNEQVQQLLRKLVAMKATAEFEALRYGQQSALFTCDFVEAAGEAQRLLDISAFDEQEHAQPATTHKALQESQFSAEESSHHSTSPPLGETSVPLLPPRGSPSKPCKPSVQAAAIRRVVSSANAQGLTSPQKPEEAGASARGSGGRIMGTSTVGCSDATVFERLYVPPSREHVAV